MILGEKGNLGQENKLLFQIMGISHILAINCTNAKLCICVDIVYKFGKE